MEWIFSAMTLLYAGYVGALYIGWRRLETTAPEETPTGEGISVVVVIRNEAENIGQLLHVLLHQEGIAGAFEILVVDDQSDDGSAAIVRSWQQKSRCIKLLQIGKSERVHGSPKKAGIVKAVRNASANLILVTDGDCIPGPGWVAGMSALFRQQDTHFVSGPVQVRGENGLWHRWQALEFASLMGAGGAMIGLGCPLMSNGANMAFRKDAFFRVHGYAGSETLASGDDVFLMMKIHRFSGGVRFRKDARAVVRTEAQATWSSFYRQRIRWAGKWHRYPLWYARLLPVFLFVYNVLFIGAFLLFLCGYLQALLFVVPAVFKIAVEYLFLRLVSSVQDTGKRFERWWFVAGSSLLYPFYAVMFGVLASVTGYQWKGRKYRH